MALASLTATYTDSEGEDDVNESENTGTVTIETPQTSPEKSTPTSRPSTPIQSTITTRVAKLVSYHDDTVVSDDENHDDSAETPTTVVITEIPEDIPIEPEPVDEDGIQLPPEPTGQCAPEVQEKFTKLYEKMRKNALDMNDIIQRRKDFRNPSIYEKLISFCGINELGYIILYIIWV